MILIIMGVTGAGKTTIGELLAAQLGWEFADADSFHSPENVEKMRRGIALSDADRVPWLQAIHDAMAERSLQNRNLVLACSALKRSYRDELRHNLAVQFIYMRGSQDFILKRLAHRTGHYATGSLVASQFRDLEEPGADEPDVMTVGIEGSSEEIAGEVLKRLRLA